MLRIECESCHAPYQVDERRVPPQGLKMRCPKCGHTFSVSASSKAPAPSTPTPADVPKQNLKMTMVGLGDQSHDANLPATKPAAPKPPPAKPVAPPVPPASKPSVDADLPAARAAPPRPGVPPRPAFPPRPVAAAKPPPVPPAPAPEIDLPAPRERHPSLPAAFGDVDLPAARPIPPKVPPKPAPIAPRAAPIPAAAPTPPSGSAFGEIDLPAVAADLPTATASLPVAAKPKPKAPPPAPAPKPPTLAKPANRELTFDLDLPQAASAPAAHKKDDLELDLGPPANDLPAPLAGLPSVSAQLPTKKDEPAFGEIDLPSLDGQLPQVQATLPQVAGSLPELAGTLPEVANALPQLGQQLPAAVDDARYMPQQKETLDFGEVDLGPLGGGDILSPPPPPPPKPAPIHSSAPFAELDLDGIDVKSLPPSNPPIPEVMPGVVMPPPAPEQHAQKATNALKFGEVDLGGQEADMSSAPIQTEEAFAPPVPSGGDELALPEAPVPDGRPSGSSGAAELSLPIQTGQRRPTPREDDAPSRAPRVALLLVVMLVIGGGALQFTKHGAFGYLTIGDYLHAKDYVTYTATQSAAARTRANKDTYPEMRGAVDDLLAAHWRKPRASGLTAYAAFAEFAYETRFGGDADRNAKAKLILADVTAQPDVKYVAAALAAEDAASGNVDKARKSLDAASKRDAGDPIQRDIALLRGEVELLEHDTKAAKTAFDTAMKLGATAPAHYGLARVANASRDWATVAAECDATLVATPHHPGALLLRAMQRYTAKGDDTNALADLAEITEGPAKALASSQEIAQAHANRGSILLASGRAGDARTAFEAALKLDNRNVDALVGQGTVLYQESRFTEALTRFDTALQSRPDNEIAIAYDAMTKVALERLKDAKDQLVAARTKFPKSSRITYALAVAEIALGNTSDAEKNLRQAIDFANPKDPESVASYLALATMLVAHNREKDAQAVIDEAKQKLPDEAPVAVAFGVYDAAQGKYEDAVTHFRHALELSPTSLSTHFKLGVTYRHMRKTDLAGQEFDAVLAIDKDYPGLALERGLLFEESGEVERALEQFKNALARAPDDADLQLRVGAAYVAIDRPDDALPMLRKVLEKRPTSAEANHYLGRALFSKEGATNEAVRYLKRAVELDPNRPEYHLYVGWAANESNPAQLGLAQDEIQKALDLDKLLADAYWQRGVLERKRFAVEDALKDLRRALELRPARVAAYATMAECYEDKNDPNTALVHWQKAIAGNGHVPYWHYRYGKLLLDHGNAAEAATHLSSAVESALKLDTKPPWLAPAEFAAAESLNRTGKRADSITMYKRFLEIASMNDPDRRDAMKALANMGETYRPGGH